MGELAIYRGHFVLHGDSNAEHGVDCTQQNEPLTKAMFEVGAQNRRNM